MFIIKYYVTESGKAPIKEFIDALDVAMQVKVFRQLSLLKEYGYKLREPHSAILLAKAYKQDFERRYRHG